MTRKELDAAFTAIQLAIRSRLSNDQPDARYLQEIAESYGRTISDPAHIKAVLGCIDTEKLFALIDASPPPTSTGATPCHNAPSATAP